MGNTLRKMVAKTIALLLFCYLLAQVEGEELASTELSAALTENAKLRDENRRLRVAAQEVGHLGEAAASTASYTAADIKCRGGKQDQTYPTGTMDCDTFLIKGKSKGSACLDNLSSGKYFHANGFCKEFNS